MNIEELWDHKKVVKVAETRKIDLRMPQERSKKFSPEKDYEPSSDGHQRWPPEDTVHGNEGGSM